MTAIQTPEPTSGLTSDAAPRTMIHLDKVSKVYPGTKVPAVEDLTLDIPEGEILVLVGPSGCGKSTTLRLINRMIEPSSGRIVFDGEDVTDVDADRLRRRIGYVIQQIGLFPHMTITDNIATVPRMLGWDDNRITARVDELLDLVGMDPSLYRDRYPKELSGGQAQRVGVARALAADPPVMLMDEPFGAIDPITRDRLQNEFLRVQADPKKTIVFVTHDIDEAIKMGDRIVVLKERSQIAQFDTPERILAHPIDDFVEDFIGSGATLKGLDLERVRDLDLTPVLTIHAGESRDEVQRKLSESDDGWVLLLDDKNRPHRWIGEHHLQRTDRPLHEVGPRVTATVEPNATLRDALEQMLHSTASMATVIDRDGTYQGSISINTLTDVIKRMQADAARHYGEAAKS